MAFKENIDILIDGEDVDDSVLNRPLLQLQDNDNYLKNILDTLSGAEAVYLRGVTCESGLTVGMAAYYNSSNQQYERALADGSVKDNVVGICISKPTSTKADLVLAGKYNVDFSTALESGSQSATRYFLSESTAGKLTSTRPATYQNAIFIADGKGSIFVFPQDRSIRGAQGYQGYQGYQGQGYQGYQGERGYQGYQGYQGNIGYQGYQGYTNKTVTKTSNYTAANETVILCNATGGALTITLPPAAAKTDWTYTIKKIDASINAVTIDADGAETIDGQLVVSTDVQYTAITIVSDGASWWII